MKKLLFVLSLILCCVSPVMADDTSTSSLSDDEWCPNGVVERGAHPTKRYCRSTFSMNWYTALAWCQVQGMHLATMSEVCDKSTALEDRWDGSKGDKKCPNFANGESSFNSALWTGTVPDSAYAYTVTAGTGNFRYNGVYRNATAYALCY